MVGSNRNIKKEPCGDEQKGDKLEKYDARAKYQKDPGCGSGLISGILFGKNISYGELGTLWPIHVEQTHISGESLESGILWMGINSDLRRQHSQVNKKFKILLRAQLAFPMLPRFENVWDFNDSSVVSPGQDLQ